MTGPVFFKKMQGLSRLNAVTRRGPLLGNTSELSKGDRHMFTIHHYVLAQSLQEAYDLNQNTGSAVLGGTLWMKLGGRAIETAIDLSALGLDKIEETEDSFRVGCMTTLRDLETHPGLEQFFDGVLRSSLEHIVGVQFRNGATVGGTVYSRFGFSDLLTVLLALDTQVEFHRGGIVPLADFAAGRPDKDILVRVIIRKTRCRSAYLSQRLSTTDFPILTCAVSRMEGRWNIVLGSLPARAKLFSFPCAGIPGREERESWIGEICRTVEFGSNARGSREYRERVAKVLIRRGIEAVTAGGDN